MQNNSQTIPANGGPRLRSYVTVSKRLESFTEWPKGLEQTPKQLAEAGFLYIGRGDHVQCFYCAGALKNWMPEDIPWIEHAHWFPACAFVLLHQGHAFVHQVQNGNKSQAKELLH